MHIFNRKHKTPLNNSQLNTIYLISVRSITSFSKLPHKQTHRHNQYEIDKLFIQLSNTSTNKQI